jgi:hypothetical protein
MKIKLIPKTLQNGRFQISVDSDHSERARLGNIQDISTSTGIIKQQELIKFLKTPLEHYSNAVPAISPDGEIRKRPYIATTAELFGTDNAIVNGKMTSASKQFLVTENERYIPLNEWIEVSILE